jgi:NADH-quinone oxidoreductase subunit L
MGALAKKIPTTYRTMLVATLAIAGIPPLAGFFSKDEILKKAFERSPALWIVGWITAGMTAFYMFRLLFMTFHGESHVDHDVEHHIHESPSAMTVPLMILAVLSIIGGWIGIGDRFEKFLEPVTTGIGAPEIAAEAGKSPERLLMTASVLLACGGIWLAWMLYIKRTDLAAAVRRNAGALYDLVAHKYYIDEIYDAMFVNRSKDLGSSLGMFDAKIIDGLGVNGAAWLTRAISLISMWWDTWIVDGSVRLGAFLVYVASWPIRLIQDGEMQEYMLIIVIGLIGFLGYTVYLLHWMR